MKKLSLNNFIIAFFSMLLMIAMFFFVGCDSFSVSQSNNESSNKNKQSETTVNDKKEIIIEGFSVEETKTVNFGDYVSLEEPIVTEKIGDEENFLDCYTLVTDEDGCFIGVSSDNKFIANKKTVYTIKYVVVDSNGEDHILTTTVNVNVVENSGIIAVNYSTFINVFEQTEIEIFKNDSQKSISYSIYFYNTETKNYDVIEENSQTSENIIFTPINLGRYKATIDGSDYFLYAVNKTIEGEVELFNDSRNVLVDYSGTSNGIEIVNSEDVGITDRFGRTKQLGKLEYTDDGTDALKYAYVYLSPREDSEYYESLIENGYEYISIWVYLDCEYDHYAIRRYDPNATYPFADGTYTTKGYAGYADTLCKKGQWTEIKINLKEGIDAWHKSFSNFVNYYAMGMGAFYFDNYTPKLNGGTTIANANLDREKITVYIDDICAVKALDVTVNGENISDSINVGDEIDFSTIFTADVELSYYLESITGEIITVSGNKYTFTKNGNYTVNAVSKYGNRYGSESVDILVNDEYSENATYDYLILNRNNSSLDVYFSEFNIQYSEQPTFVSRSYIVKYKDEIIVENDGSKFTADKDGFYTVLVDSTYMDGEVERHTLLKMTCEVDKSDLKVWNNFNSSIDPDEYVVVYNTTNWYQYVNNKEKTITAQYVDSLPNGTKGNFVKIANTYSSESGIEIVNNYFALQVLPLHTKEYYEKLAQEGYKFTATIYVETSTDNELSFYYRQNNTDTVVKKTLSVDGTAVNTEIIITFDLQNLLDRWDAINTTYTENTSGVIHTNSSLFFEINATNAIWYFGNMCLSNDYEFTKEIGATHTQNIEETTVYNAVSSNSIPDVSEYINDFDFKWELTNGESTVENTDGQFDVSSYAKGNYTIKYIAVSKTTKKSQVVYESTVNFNAGEELKAKVTNSDLHLLTGNNTFDISTLVNKSDVIAKGNADDVSLLYSMTRVSPTNNAVDYTSAITNGIIDGSKLEVGSYKVLVSATFTGGYVSGEVYEFTLDYDESNLKVWNTFTSDAVYTDYVYAYNSQSWWYHYNNGGSTNKTHSAQYVSELPNGTNGDFVKISNTHKNATSEYIVLSCFALQVKPTHSKAYYQALADAGYQFTATLYVVSTDTNVPSLKYYTTASKSLSVSGSGLETELILTFDLNVLLDKWDLINATPTANTNSQNYRNQSLFYDAGVTNAIWYFGNMCLSNDYEFTKEIGATHTQNIEETTVYNAVSSNSIPNVSEYINDFDFKWELTNGESAVENTDGQFDVSSYAKGSYTIRYIATSKVTKETQVVYEATVNFNGYESFKAKVTDTDLHRIVGSGTFDISTLVKKGDVISQGEESNVTLTYNIVRNSLDDNGVSFNTAITNDIIDGSQLRTGYYLVTVTGSFASGLSQVVYEFTLDYDAIDSFVWYPLSESYFQTDTMLAKYTYVWAGNDTSVSAKTGSAWKRTYNNGITFTSQQTSFNTIIQIVPVHSAKYYENKTLSFKINVTNTTGSAIFYFIRYNTQANGGSNAGTGKTSYSFGVDNSQSISISGLTWDNVATLGADKWTSGITIQGRNSDNIKSIIGTFIISDLTVS